MWSALIWINKAWVVKIYAYIFIIQGFWVVYTLSWNAEQFLKSKTVNSSWLAELRNNGATLFVEPAFRVNKIELLAVKSRICVSMPCVSGIFLTDFYMKLSPVLTFCMVLISTEFSVMTSKSLLRVVFRSGKGATVYAYALFFVWKVIHQCTQKHVLKVVIQVKYTNRRTFFFLMCDI